MKTLTERFNEKWEPVTETGCWIWMASVLPQGYGNFGFNGKIEKAHRAAYMLFKGQIPEGMFVCHRCDVPSCVNPTHLFLGTPKDNTQDMINKRRDVNHGPKGEAHRKAKLTENDVITIRTMEGKLLQREIGDLYGITQKAVSAILRRVNWRHI